MSENCNYAPVEKVILIDDRRIEIYWGEQMRRADNENDYLVKYKGEVQELVHWTSDMTWDMGRDTRKNPCVPHFPWFIRLIRNVQERLPYRLSES